MVVGELCQLADSVLGVEPELFLVVVEVVEEVQEQLLIVVRKQFCQLVVVVV